MYSSRNVPDVPTVRCYAVCRQVVDSGGALYRGHKGLSRSFPLRGCLGVHYTHVLNAWRYDVYASEAPERRARPASLSPSLAVSGAFFDPCPGADAAAMAGTGADRRRVAL